jgi:hypothetical protein
MRTEKALRILFSLLFIDKSFNHSQRRITNETHEFILYLPSDSYCFLSTKQQPPVTTKGGQHEATTFFEHSIVGRIRQHQLETDTSNNELPRRFNRFYWHGGKQQFGDAENSIDFIIVQLEYTGKSNSKWRFIKP